MMRQKKAQTTIFMVIGLLVIIGGIVFFYSTQTAQQAVAPEIKIIQEKIPVEFDPIRNYVSGCAYSVGVEGLGIIGEQGGYASLSDRSLNTEPFIITQNPTESDAVSFTKGSGLKIPYWWHLKSPNNCIGDCSFESKKPDLRQTENSIEKQLERYVNLKLRGCLSNFEPFTSQGFRVVETGKIRTDVTISSEDVAVLVDFPVNVESGDEKIALSQFLVRIPVSLSKIYELAAKLAELEMRHRYLEKHALNLVTAFSGLDEEKLPPMSDMQFKLGSGLSWQKSSIGDRITGLLVSYMPLFQVDGTYNYERNIFESELKQRLYDSTIIPVANSSFRDLAAYFTYLDFWPAYFDLNCKGERCIPSSANSLISLFGIQTYRFAYDLSFPVLVEINDPFALNGKGYSFNFFLEGNIRNNKPMPANFAPLARGTFSERSLLCDARTSGNVTIHVASAANKKPIDDAKIFYTLIDENCFIGSTNQNGILKEAFPGGVVGGVVNIAKDEYLGKAVEFDARAGADSSLSAELQPVYRKNLIVKKKNVVKTLQGWQFVNAPVELSTKESAVVTLIRASDEGEIDFSSAANYEGQKEPAEIEIAPGNYAADITLVLDERVVIPESQRCVRKGIFGSRECFTVPKVDFGERAAPGQEKFSEGGLRLNFTITAGELEKNNTIVLYAVSIALTSVPEQERSIEDIGQIGKVEDYSGIYQLALQPTFQ